MIRVDLHFSVPYEIQVFVFSFSESFFFIAVIVSFDDGPSHEVVAQLCHWLEYDTKQNLLRSCFLPVRAHFLHRSCF